MNPKYQVGQEVWTVWFDNKRYQTTKSVIEEVYTSSSPTKQLIFTGNEPIYKLNNGPKDYYSPEWSLHSSEKEAYEYFVYDVFVSSKNCWKFELKFWEREEKLKRILDER